MPTSLLLLLTLGADARICDGEVLEARVPGLLGRLLFGVLARACSVSWCALCVDPGLRGFASVLVRSVDAPRRGEVPFAAGDRVAGAPLGVGVALVAARGALCMLRPGVDVALAVGEGEVALRRRAAPVAVAGWRKRLGTPVVLGYPPDAPGDLTLLLCPFGTGPPVDFGLAVPEENPGDVRPFAIFGGGEACTFDGEETPCSRTVFGDCCLATPDNED